MATWGDLEKDTGLGLLGIKEKLTALEAEHALCGGDRRRQLARIEELESQNAGLATERQSLTDQVSAPWRDEAHREAGTRLLKV